MTGLVGSLLGDSEKLGDVHESENLHLRELHLPLTRLRAKPTVQSELEAGHYGSLRHLEGDEAHPSVSRGDLGTSEGRPGRRIEDARVVALVGCVDQHGAIRG